jgi:uncharacterized delta-60 repeat protein
MSLFSWLRGSNGMADSAQMARFRRRTAPSRPSFRPRLEALEDRCLLSGGVLDPTFGSGGLVTTAIGSFARSYAVATYPNEGTANDGKIVAVGDAFAGRKSQTEYMAVVRYNLDGTLDRTFGGSGEVMTILGRALAVQVQPDGKIVAAGNSGGHFAVVRYNPDGTLDASFGSNGEVITTITKNSEDIGEAMVLQADGKIVVAGETNPMNTTYEDLALVRYNANGALDATFGTGGKVTTRFAAPLESGSNPPKVKMAIDPNTSPLDSNSGKIIVVVVTQTAGGEVVRYNTNGILDTGFGTSQGYVNLGNLYQPAVAVQADDRIVLAGIATDATTGLSDIGLDRLNADGTLDTSFGSGGVVATSSSPNQDYARSVTIQADGKIVVAGDQGNAQSGDNSFLAARYNSNGSLDTTFGVNGVATAGSDLGSAAVVSMALEPDGRIVLAGFTAGSSSVFSLARFLAAGPQIGSFTASPNPVTAGSSTTLTASNITDGNPGSTITQVAFYYLDSSGAKHVLGYGTQTSPGVWTLNFTVNPASGSYTLFAQAEDSYGVFGDPLAITVTVM